MKLNKSDVICIELRKTINEKKHNYKQWFLKKFEIIEEVLQFRKKLWVLENDELRLNILKKIHDQLVVKHSSIRRTLNLIKRHFYWSRMRELVKKYVRNCHLCRRFKTLKNKYSDLLNSLLISNQLWFDISMNFVTDLFLNLNDLYNAILMMICRLSKMHHYISCFSENDKTSTEETSKMLLTHVWKLHDLSIIIIFDRDS
jgi:hypothetical protein